MKNENIVKELSSFVLMAANYCKVFIASGQLLYN